MSNNNNDVPATITRRSALKGAVAAAALGISGAATANKLQQAHQPAK